LKDLLSSSVGYFIGGGVNKIIIKSTTLKRPGGAGRVQKRISQRSQGPVVEEPEERGRELWGG